MTDMHNRAEAQCADSISEKAAYWFARLRSDACPASEKRKFRDWLRSSPQHVSAFRHHQHIWDEVGDVAGDDDILAMRNAALMAHGDTAPKHWGRYAAIAASILVALVSVTTFSLMSRPPATTGEPAQDIRIAQADTPTAQPTIYRTHTGQRSTVNLLDGSVVELNTDSLLQVNYSSERRHIVLLKGEAFFNVAKDPSRPFIVLANDKRVTAVGTSFAVRMDDDRVRVTLVEGVVTVDRASADGVFHPDDDKIVEWLRAGEQLLAVTGQPFRKRPIDTQIATSWRQGRLIFDNEPLSRIVPELNRYTTRKLIIGDDSLADMRVSGSFRAGSTDNFAKTLEVTFPVQVDVDEDRNRLVLRWNR